MKLKGKKIERVQEATMNKTVEMWGRVCRTDFDIQQMIEKCIHERMNCISVDLEKVYNQVNKLQFCMNMKLKVGSPRMVHDKPRSQKNKWNV